MDYRLSRGWSYCVAAGRVVMLDLPRDRYIALPSSWTACLAKLSSQKFLSEEDRTALSGLIKLGALEVAPGGDGVQACIASPIDTSLDREAIRPKAADVIRALLALLQARWLLRSRTLEGVVTRLVRDKVQNSRSSQVAAKRRLEELATAFRRAEAGSTRHDQCLARSFAMAFMAARVGIPVNLIIGVKARPFGAHCWVQYEQFVVNDEAEMVRNYTPILAI